MLAQGKIITDQKDNCNFHRKTNGSKLRNKVFQARNSLFTDMLQNEHMITLRNAWPAVFLYTILYSVIKDFQNKEWPNFGTKLIRTTLFKFDVALLIWICVLLSSLFVYYVFLIWGHYRKLIVKKSFLDKSVILLFLIYIIGLCYFTAEAAVSYELGVGSSMAVMMEMTRILMKLYAFVRSNCSKFLNNKEDNIAPLSHYLYFLFAPTLIYKDVYPRSNGAIRWSVALQYFIGLAQLIIVKSITYEHTFKYYLEDYGKKVFTLFDVVAIISLNSIVGVYFFVILQFGIHCLMNGAAELLRFSDREFYKDWWTSRTADECLRKWNTIVYDWLYIYIYKDVYENLWPHRKGRARIAALVISAFFHDMILCVACRNYLPLITFVYLCIILLRPLLNSNSLFILLNGFYISTLYTLYGMEYYARLNCPLENVTLLENIKPRFLYC